MIDRQKNREGIKIISHILEKSGKGGIKALASSLLDLNMESGCNGGK